MVIDRNVEKKKKKKTLIAKYKIEKIQVSAYHFQTNEMIKEISTNNKCACKNGKKIFYKLN